MTDMNLTGVTPMVTRELRGPSLASTIARGSSVQCLGRCDTCLSPALDGSSTQRVTLRRSTSWSGRMSRDWIALLIFVGICFAVGASGSVVTASSVKTWYPGLLKPAGTPPPWVFGPVWSILYLLMAAAAWMVWRQRFQEDVW